MAQWLRGPAVLLKDPGLISSTYMVAYNFVTIPVPGDLIPSSDLCRHQAQAQCIYIHAFIHTYIYIYP